MSETEREVLRLTLWVFGFSFAVKAVVFTVLASTMLRKPSATPLGVALLVHYTSIAVQAVILATLYLYYADVIPLPFRVRMATYGLAILTVAWVIGSGLLLIFTYWRVRQAMDTPP